jgi:GntR family transcriptional regulator
LAEALRAEIANGRYRVGDKIPTEPQLCSDRGVSRNTVRLAVDRLVQEGLLDRQQGRGTYVSAPPTPAPQLFAAPPTPLYRFRLLEHGWVRAPEALALQFGLVPDGRLFRMTRVRLEDGRPVALKRYYAPADVLREQPTTEEIESAPFDQILSGRGVRLARMNLMARPALLGAEDAVFLEASAGTLSLRTQRVGFNEHGRAIRLSETVLVEPHASLFWSVRRPLDPRPLGEGVTFSTWTAAALD